MLPHGTTPKIRDFRTFLEIWSFALAGKPTDANFVYYNINVPDFQYFMHKFQFIFQKMYDKIKMKVYSLKFTCAMRVQRC